MFGFLSDVTPYDSPTVDTRRELQSSGIRGGQRARGRERCCACCGRHRAASPDPRKKHGQIRSLQGNRDLWVSIAGKVGSGRAYKRGLHATNLVLLNSGIDHGSCKILIGLGRGASELKAHVTISSVTQGHKTTVLELDLSSESGKKPGAALGMGSVAIGAAAGGVSDRKSRVEADAVRMAKLVAKHLEAFMADQRWISYPPKPGMVR